MEPLIKFGVKSIAPFLTGKAYSSIFILTDENSRKHCLPFTRTIVKTNNVIQIKSGEKNKTLATCERIWKNLLENHADRNSLLINLGGGVLCDMGGFCASTYKRGIDFINIPTTLIAMADASIGGKTGVDFSGLKNSVGLFSQPKFICIDPAFLKTLPQRELISGSAELFKHALLQNKKEVSSHLKKPFALFNPKEKENLIRRSVQFKNTVVRKDALEKNSRRQLNLGHTFGHAFESYFLNYAKPLLHGEAVALGLVAEAYLAHCFYGLSYDYFLNVVFWYDLNFKKPDLGKMNFNTIITLMGSDKKNKNTEIRPVLPEKEGRVATGKSITTAQINETLKFIVAF